MDRTIEVGHTVHVFACKKCGQNSDSDMVCEAPSYDKVVQVITSETPKRPSVGTDEYVAAANARSTELHAEGLSMVKVIAKMIEEGWVFDSEPKAEEMVVLSNEVTEPTTETEAITLDKVIEAIKIQAVEEEKKYSHIDLEQILKNRAQK